MSGFLGEYEVRLDAKGRFRIPADLKEQLYQEDNGRFVINKGFEKHLVLYPHHAWQLISEKLDKLNLFVKKNREFVRYFNKGARRIQLDGNDRILVPKHLLSYAGMKQDVIILAYANRIELWSPDLYNQEVEIPPEDVAGLAEQVMGEDE